MKSDAWMPLYVADYLRDTSHLSPEEHGGYLLLLMGCWTRGGLLPKEEVKLSAIAHMSPQAWKRCRTAILEFFSEEASGWTHKRVTSELWKARDLSEKRRNAGAKGGRPRSQAESKPKPNAFANEVTNSEQSETPACVARPSPSPSESSLRSDSSDGWLAPPAEPTAGLTLSGDQLAAFDAARGAQRSSLLTQLIGAAAEVLANPPGPGLADPAPILGLVEAAGADACDLYADVLPTIATVSKAKKPGSVNSWAYFVPAIIRAHDERLSNVVHATRAAPKPTRGARLSPDWTPSNEDRRYALEKGLNDQEIDDAAEEFRNYWCSESGRHAIKLDWSRVWQNNVPRAVERKRGRGARLAPSADRSGGGGRGRVSIADIAFREGAFD